MQPSAKQEHTVQTTYDLAFYDEARGLRIHKIFQAQEISPCSPGKIPSSIKRVDSLLERGGLSEGRSLPDVQVKMAEGDIGWV